MSGSLIPDSVLANIADRAAGYDAANEFCATDILELKECGYFAAAVPAVCAGAGATLLQISQAQQRLAAAAPATALAANMHQVWICTFQMLHQNGCALPEWIFSDVLKGEIFAFGISEPGNDKVLFDAATVAHPIVTDKDLDNHEHTTGYELYGTKIFTTLSPVWSRLGIHAKTPDGRLVFGFVRREGVDPRSAENASSGLLRGKIKHLGKWNMLGMRATHSYNTQLVGVLLQQGDILTETVPLDYTNQVQAAIFASFSLLTASVYLGIGQRALELAQQTGVNSGARAADPHANAAVVSAYQQYLSARSTVELLCERFGAKVATAADFMTISAAKLAACDSAKVLVETAIKVVGARAYQADSELARLWRDVLAGVFHPTSFTSFASSARSYLEL